MESPLPIKMGDTQPEPKLAEIAGTSSDIIDLSPEAHALNKTILEKFDTAGHPKRLLENMFGAEDKVDIDKFIQMMFEFSPAPDKVGKPDAYLVLVTSSFVHTCHLDEVMSFSRK